MYKKTQTKNMFSNLQMKAVFQNCTVELNYITKILWKLPLTQCSDIKPKATLQTTEELKLAFWQSLSCNKTGQYDCNVFI